MKNTTRALRLFQFVLAAFMLFGCASAADDDSLPPADEMAEPASQALKGAASIEDAALEADAADCDAAAAVDGAAGSYEELTSILDTASVNGDEAAELAAGGTCRRVCACCRRGNRFCCSHCRFCSGPIGPYGLSSSVLAD
jgi:hypothetical protein